MARGKRKISKDKDNNKLDDQKTVKKARRKKWKEVKERDSLTIIIGRKNAKRLPDEILSQLSIKEINYWNESIFTDKNVTAYKKLENKTQRVTFIGNIVANNIGTVVTVKKFNEEKEELEIMERVEIIDYVKKKFVKKLHDNKSKNAKMAVIPKKEVKVKSSRENKSQSETFQNLPLVEELYPDLKPEKSVTSERWFEYSCIHSLFESFQFVIYNGSHKLNDGMQTHRCLRIVLKFPAKRNFFILFHGNLVHNGASSKVEPVDGSMNYAADLRAFAYIHRYETKRTQKKRDGLKDRATHSEDPTIGTTYIGCRKMDTLHNKCEVCDEYMNSKKGKLFSSNGCEIDLEKVYKKSFLKARGKVVC